MTTYKITLVLALLGLLLGAIFLYQVNHQINKPNYIEKPLSKPFERAISAWGIVEASGDNINIGVPVSALVTQVFVKVDDRVKAGQPLFQLDDRDSKSLVLVDEAKLKVAEAKVKRLQEQLKNLSSVKDPTSISPDRLTTSQNDTAIAEAEENQAKAQLTNSRVNLERLTIRSPIDATVLQVNIHPGEYASSEVTQPLMVIGDVDTLQVRVYVDEENASKFNSQAEALAYPVNDTNHPIKLQFVRVDPLVTPKKVYTGSYKERVDTRVFQVIYSFKNDNPNQIYVGQQVDVFIKVMDEQKKT